MIGVGHYLGVQRRTDKLLSNDVESLFTNKCYDKDHKFGEIKFKFISISIFLDRAILDSLYNITKGIALNNQRLATHCAL